MLSEFAKKKTTHQLNFIKDTVSRNLSFIRHIKACEDITDADEEAMISINNKLFRFLDDLEATVDKLAEHQC